MLSLPYVHCVRNSGARANSDFVIPLCQRPVSTMASRHATSLLIIYLHKEFCTEFLFIYFCYLFCATSCMHIIGLDYATPLAALSPQKGDVVAHLHRPNCVVTLEHGPLLATPHRRFINLLGWRFQCHAATCSITSARLGASPLRSVEIFARPHRAWG